MSATETIQSAIDVRGAHSLHPVVGHPPNRQKISENSSCISRLSGYCVAMKTNYSKVTDDNGNTIGWTHAAKDGSGYYSQAGLKPKKNFFGFKHESESKAVESLRRNHAELMKRVEVI